MDDIIDGYYKGSKALAIKSAMNRRIELGQFSDLARPALSLVSKTDTTINLSGTNPDNLPDVELYQDGTLIGEGSLTTWDLTGLNPETSYTFTMRVGSGGNWSPMSSPLTVVTDEAGSEPVDPVDPNAPVITQLAIVGASIMQQSFQGVGSTITADAARSQMLNMGIDLPFRTYAASGSDIDAAIAQANLIVSHLGERDGIAVFVHTGGNETFDWDTSTQEQRDHFKNRLEQVYQIITNAGYHLIPTPLSWVNNSGVTYNRQQIGINLIYPLIEQYAPYWWDSVENKPIMNIYEALESIGSNGFNENDVTHPNAVGREHLRNYIYQKLNSRLFLPQYDNTEAISLTMNLAPLETPANNIRVTGPTPITTIFNNRGEQLSGSITVQGIAWSSGGSGGSENQSDYSNYSSDWATRRIAKWGSNSDVTFDFTIPSYANKTGTLHYVGGRSGSTRSTSVTANSVTQLAPAGSGAPAIIPIQFDGSGNLSILAEPIDRFAYFSGLTIYLD